MNALSSKRVWSLWEMLEFNAHSFVHSMNGIAHLVGIANRDAKWLLKDQSRKDFLLGILDTLILHLKNLNLRLSLKKAETLKFSLNMKYEDTTSHAAFIDQNFNELKERIQDELEGKVFYAFSKDTEYLLADAPLFGEEVGDKFPKATEDISEAGKCLALERSTASVFHLMRAMELAVQALYTAIGLMGNPEREWGKLLSDIHGAIEKMDKGPKRDEWSATHTHLYHVKQTWRNDVMHPKQTYTPDEAKAVFDAVRSFMQHLAKLIV
jgi:hypothetical protein